MNRIFIHSNIGSDDNEGTQDMPLMTFKGLIKYCMETEMTDITIIWYDNDMGKWRQLE